MISDLKPQKKLVKLVVYLKSSLAINNSMVYGTRRFNAVFTRDLQ
jgi:hypothetical protein